jgi:hypothetical protein
MEEAGVVKGKLEGRLYNADPSLQKLNDMVIRCCHLPDMHM